MTFFLCVSIFFICLIFFLILFSPVLYFYLFVYRICFSLSFISILLLIIPVVSSSFRFYCPCFPIPYLSNLSIWSFLDLYLSLFQLLFLPLLVSCLFLAIFMSFYFSILDSFLHLPFLSTVFSSLTCCFISILSHIHFLNFFCKVSLFLMLLPFFFSFFWISSLRFLLVLFSLCYHLLLSFCLLCHILHFLISYEWFYFPLASIPQIIIPFVLSSYCYHYLCFPISVLSGFAFLFPSLINSFSSFPYLILSL